MVRLINDEHGQWIILSGMTIAIGLILLALMLNQAMLSGTQSSGAETQFPKNDIRELRDESLFEAQRMWSESGDETNFTYVTAPDYDERVSAIYAAHGQAVNVTMISSGTNITVRVNFSDGRTFYSETMEVEKPT